MAVLESLIVDRKPFGISQFSCCRGELSDNGSLIVRVIETGAVVETFKSGTWGSAQITDVGDSARITNVRGLAQITDVWGSAQLDDSAKRAVVTKAKP